jgi:hypothetical protein
MSTRNLPFPRGKTGSFDAYIAGPNGLLSVLPTATGLVGEATAYRPDLAGRTFDIEDDVIYPNQTIKLRAVQAQANITVARKCVTFSTTAEQFGAVTTSPAIPSGGTAGLIAKPIDPAYAVGTVIKKYDWFYVVEEGWAELLVGTTTTAQGSVMCDGDGAAAPATAGAAVVGTSESAVTADGTETGYVYVKGGLATSDAATAA